MNRRILKKRCKHAMEVLIRDHGYLRKDFYRSDGQESVYAPAGMGNRSRAVEHGFLEPGPLKGTPLHCVPGGGESPEWSCDLPSEILDDIVMWSFFVYRNEVWDA